MFRVVLILFIFVKVMSMLRWHVGEGSCSEAINTVPSTVVIQEESDYSVVVESPRRASRKWRDAEVPVLGELENWKGKVLHKSVILFNVKLARGASMGVGGMESNILDVVWFMHFLEWKVSLEQ